MLFVIEQSVAELFATGNARQLDVEGLDYLALSVAEGSHRVIGPRKVLMALSEETTLQRKTRKVLERAAARVAEEGRLHHQLTVYGVVDAGNGTVPVSAKVGAQRVIQFPLRWFDHSEKVQLTVLLGEHLSDAHVLESVGGAGSILAGLSYLSIKSRRDHGGGSTIPVVLNENATHNCLCICIVDSDRACPGGTLGGTALSVQAFKNTTSFPLIEVLETSGRDLENILPKIFYRCEYGANHQYAVMVSTIEYLTECEESDLLAHLDIEKGVTLRQIFKHVANSPERAFWDAKLPIISAHVGIAPTALPCLATGSCSALPSVACTCVVVAGIPANILERFTTRYKDCTRYDLAKWLDNSVRPEWARLGSSIASWCFGDDRLRV